MKTKLMKTNFLLIVLAIVFASCQKELVTPVDEGEPPSSWGTNPVNPRIKAVAAYNTTVGGYMESLPNEYEYNKTKRFPLLICIHGINELGNGTSDIYKVANKGVPELIQADSFPTTINSRAGNFSMIVIAPQFRSWPSAVTLNYFINYVIKNYRIDTTRIYLTGYSMGGGVVWEYARTFPNRIAAIVPICGASCPSPDKAKAIAGGGIAVWAFHNNADPKISCSYTNNYVTYINSFHPVVPAKKTIFEAAKHNAWRQAYNPFYKENGMNIYQWMLQYKRQPSKLG